MRRHRRFHAGRRHHLQPRAAADRDVAAVPVPQAEDRPLAFRPVAALARVGIWGEVSTWGPPRERGGRFRAGGCEDTVGSRALAIKRAVAMFFICRMKNDIRLRPTSARLGGRNCLERCADFRPLDGLQPVRNLKNDSVFFGLQQGEVQVRNLLQIFDRFEVAVRLAISDQRRGLRPPEA